MAKLNAACRPVWNGPEMSCGKNELPVSVAWSDAETALSAWSPTSCWIGL